jgi:hypothetical protein
MQHGFDDPPTQTMLREHGITHIYIGQQQGQVGAPAGSILDVPELVASPYATLRYHEDRVWIFELVR